MRDHRRRISRLALLASVLTLPLAASGVKGDKGIYDACLETMNGDEKLCECVAQEGTRTLSEEQRTFAAAVGRGDKAAADAAKAKLAPMDIVPAALFWNGAPADCAIRLDPEAGDLSDQ